MAKQSSEQTASVEQSEKSNSEHVVQEAPKAKRTKKQGDSNGFVLCDVIKLEKKLTGEKDAVGNVLFDLVEEKKLKQVKILREHMSVHAEQERNTLKRYKEVEA